MSNNPPRILIVLKMANELDACAKTTERKACKCKNIAKQGLYCVNCGTVFHPGCLSKLKNCVKLDSESIKCGEITCKSVNLNPEQSDLDTSFASVDSNFDATIHEISFPSVDATKDQQEVFYLKELIKHKNVIINQLLNKVSSQRKEILILQQLAPSSEQVPTLRKVSQENTVNAMQTATHVRKPALSALSDSATAKPSQAKSADVVNKNKNKHNNKKVFVNKSNHSDQSHGLQGLIGAVNSVDSAVDDKNTPTSSSQKRLDLHW